MRPNLVHGKSRSREIVKSEFILNLEFVAFIHNKDTLNMVIHSAHAQLFYAKKHMTMIFF